MAPPLVKRWGRHALALLLLLLPFAPLWWSGQLLMSEDAINFESSWLGYVRQLWSNGRLEEWFPFSDGGMPLTGATLGRLFDPLQVWFLLADPLRGLLGFYLLHSLLAYGCAYLYLRHRQLSANAAALGALAYAGSSARVHMAANVVFYPILTFAPLALLTLERCLARPGPRPALALSLVAVLILSGGGWQLTAIIGANLVLFCWLEAAPARRAVSLGWAALALLLALWITAPTWLPLAEQSRQGVLRSTPFEPEWLEPGSLPRALDLGALYSPFYGSRADALQQKQSNLHEFVAVAGVAVLPLWMLALRSRRRPLLVWGGLLLLDTFFALGPANPAMLWLHRHAPLIGNFRVPLRYLSPFPMWLMGAVAWGAEDLLASRRRWPLLAALPMAYYLAYLLWGRSDWWEAHLLLLASVAAAAVLALWPRARSQALWLALALQLMAPVLWTHGSIFCPQAPVDAEQVMLTDVAGALKPGEQVFYSVHPGATALAGVRNASVINALALRSFADYLFWMLHGRAATSAEYQALLFQNFAPAALEAGADPGWPLSPMSRMLGIRLLISRQGIQSLPDPLPGFWVSARSRQLPPEPAFLAMRQPGFRPEDEVVLEPVEPRQMDPPYAPGQPVWLTHRPSFMELELRGASGWVTVPIPDYPGWTAEIDGRPAPLLRSYNLFSSVRVEPGSQRLSWRYRCEPFWRGCWWMAAGLLGWLALLLSSRLRK